MITRFTLYEIINQNIITSFTSYSGAESEYTETLKEYGDYECKIGAIEEMKHIFDEETNKYRRFTILETFTNN